MDTRQRKLQNLLIKESLMTFFAWLSNQFNARRKITVAVYDIFVTAQYRAGQENTPCGRAYEPVPARKGCVALHEIEPTLLPADFDGKLTILSRNETTTRPLQNFVDHG
jgi:hypothetical protein